MSEAKHTPLPWIWLEGQPQITRYWNGTDRPIAEVLSSLPWHENYQKASEEAGANAGFICLACNNHEALVGALKKARDALRTCDDCAEYGIDNNGETQFGMTFDPVTTDDALQEVEKLFAKLEADK